MAQTIDLLKMFGAASKALEKNQSALNEADAGNHDHGDNMVKIFDVITEAMKAKKGEDPADQLAYASELLRQRTTSGSGKMYANNLEQASQTFKEKVLTPENAALLVQTLMGAAQQQQQPAESGGGDLIGSLLSGFLGGGGEQAASAPAQDQQADQNLDVSDLVGAGLTFLQAKQEGKKTTDALVGALMSQSLMGNQAHRAQSGAIVAKALMSAVNAVSKKK